MYFVLYITLLFAFCYAETDDKSEICLFPNGYIKDEGTCDGYIACEDYTPTRRLCPDGLNFNPETRWPMAPCSFPADVPCHGSDISQPARSTDDCPRQFGFFRSPVAGENHCEKYRLCSDGIAYDMSCPLGLAFDEKNARCDWPDAVPGCGADVIYNFNCPAPLYDLQDNPITMNFRHESSCIMFYSCVEGRGRLLSCDPGFAFDSHSGRCVEEEKVDCSFDTIFDYRAKVLVPTVY